MSHQEISRREQGLSHLPFRAVLPAKLSPVLFYIFFAITVLAIFIPLNPKMPSEGLDPSWEFAMNEGVARHMSFGKEIVFTFGPYASILTRTYSPATDGRMMWGSLLLAVCYGTALLFLSRGQKRYILVILLLFLATFGSEELLLLSYSFLIAVCALKQINSDDKSKVLGLPWRQVLAVVVMWSTLGLLPLVKGSLLLPFAASAAIPSIFLFYRFHVKQALLLLFIPVLAAVTFWISAGQSLADLPAYLRGTIELTSGYTEAMALPWGTLPSVVGDGLVFAFLALSTTLFWSIRRFPQFSAASKWMLTILCAVFLLVVFKHGFIATAALSGAFSSFAVFILILGFLYMDRYLIWSLSIIMVLTAATSVMRDGVLIEEVRARFGVGAVWSGGARGDILAFCVERASEAYSRTTYKSTWNTYSQAWSGLRARVSRNNSLAVRFARAKADIRSEYALPALNGTADFYEYDQSVLLASNNEWNPRPIIQSYSAYTPALVRLNEQHLRGPGAPEWVLVDLQSIEGRLPSLDDGMSWPALLDNYSLTSYEGQFVLMRRKAVVLSSSNYENVDKKTCKTGAMVLLPNTDGLLFAEVDLKPTLAGQLLIALFDPPQLKIEVDLGDGTSRSYRVVSNMMKTGFLVSPLIANTDDFASLAAGIAFPKNDRRVERISITPTYGGSVFWSDTYTLTLKKYIRE
jgi:hypothetical protein